MPTLVSLKKKMKQIELECDTESRDKNGGTAMHIAAYHDNVGMVEKLILEEADRWATNK